MWESTGIYVQYSKFINDLIINPLTIWLWGMANTTPRSE